MSASFQIVLGSAVSADQSTTVVCDWQKVEFQILLSVWNIDCNKTLSPIEILSGFTALGKQGPQRGDSSNINEMK